MTKINWPMTGRSSVSAKDAQGSAFNTAEVIA